MKLISIIVIALFLVSELPAQFAPRELNTFKLKDNSTSLRLCDKSLLNREYSRNSLAQFKKRKTVTSYVGAGYSFVIFTAGNMNTAYPVLDSRSGDFLSEINLYFGFAIAQAVTLEFEPSILFTNNDRSLTIILNNPRVINGVSYPYVLPSTLSMLAFPLVGNARFFPFFKQNNFARLFFIGGGVGTIWIREEYDNYYSETSVFNYLNYAGPYTESTNQWQPLLRVMTGFTGTGGQFGFGGELRYNFVPLKQSNDPFVTRIAPNFNSVDLTLRFYFSL